MLTRIKKLYKSYILFKSKINDIIFMERFKCMDPESLIDYVEYSSRKAAKMIEDDDIILSPEDITDEITDIYNHLELLANAMKRLKWCQFSVKSNHV